MCSCIIHKKMLGKLGMGPPIDHFQIKMLQNRQIERSTILDQLYLLIDKWVVLVQNHNPGNSKKVNSLYSTKIKLLQKI